MTSFTSIKNRPWPLLVLLLLLPACASSIDTSSTSSSSESSISSSSEDASSSSSSSTSLVDPSLYQIENGGLETGDLSGWTILSGTAFDDGGVSSLTQISGTTPYNKEGTFFYRGVDETREGILISSAFTIGGSGYITFKLGGAYLQALTYISFVDATSDIEFYRVGNSLFHEPTIDDPSYIVENMNDYIVDLRAHKGKLVRIKIVDQSRANHGYITFDDFITYHPNTPDINDYTISQNIMPLFTDYQGTPNLLYNGDFATNTLAGFSVVGEDGVFQDSHIDVNGRLSNRADETKIGVLRSSAFKVSGTDLISLRVGATKHPDLTYVSIKRVGTNEEVHRMYSDRWKDADEENTHLYYIDLSNYHLDALYLEFVDNSRADWGLLTIEDIVTLYLEYPDVIDEIGYNLFDLVNTNPAYDDMRNYINPFIAGVEDETERLTLQKTFYASIDGISNIKGNWPSVIQYRNNGNTFIITGDINAMWLRDSSAQVLPYLQFMTIDEDVKNMVKGLLRMQFEFIRRNQYANAFNHDGSVFELKFEIDSLMYPLWLAYEYYRITQDATPFDAFFMLTLRKVIDTLNDERNHDDDNYRIDNQSDRDAGPHDVNTESGLIWSGYRPSDDVTYYKFFIPGNMFAVATLEKMSELLSDIQRFGDLASEALTLANEVRTAIETYGVYMHPTYGKMYAFEVDGFTSDINSSNGKLLMDAANIPSLLSIPWLGYAPIDDVTYQNTRSFILSDDNPYYYEGTYASGIGDPHDGIGGSNPHPETPVPWHMAIAMQGLTSDSMVEIETMIDYMTNTTAGTYVMHEAFNADDPNVYSRDWFTWPCALYAHLYITKILNINLDQ